MAPQVKEEFAEEAGARPVLTVKTAVTKLVVVTTIVAMATVALYSLSAVTPERAETTIARAVGDDIKEAAHDCSCIGACSAKPNAAGVHTCAVGTVNCMGIDYKKATLAAGVKADKDCVDAAGKAIPGKCTAVCEYITGRYDCWNFPCLNGGWCQDGTNDYECHCAFGYTGKNCEKDIDECKLKGKDYPCTGHSLCVNSDGKYSCECKTGWVGDGYVVDHAKTNVKMPYWLNRKAKGASSAGCTDFDDCASNPCYHGECTNTIAYDYKLHGFKCACDQTHLGEDGWVGKRCGTNIDECAAVGAAKKIGHTTSASTLNDCDEKAKCLDNAGSFTCECKEHWTAFDKVSAAKKGPFNHKGHSNGFVDTAKLAGGGLRGCYDHDDCASGPCKNGGTCTEGPAGCEIQGRCEKPAYKSVEACEAGGNKWLEDGFTMVDCYKCTCAYGWSGKTCEKDENECATDLASRSDQGEYNVRVNQCNEHSLCTNTPGSYLCACNLGWTGTAVSGALGEEEKGKSGCWDANDCEFNPCAHGGTCNDCGTLCMTCECVPGWRGTTCGVDWNECLMGIHMCSNEATCVNTPGSYACKCDPGYTGDGIGLTVQELDVKFKVGGVEKTKHVIHGCKDIDDCIYDEHHKKWPARQKLVKGKLVKEGEGPCIHGTCRTGKGPKAYTCSCNKGWQDTNCDNNINECMKETACHRFAQCTDLEGTYSCKCKPGYIGNGRNCVDENDCKGQCQHGFCTDLGVNDFKCKCNTGWQDKLCDMDIDECATYTHGCAPNAECRNYHAVIKMSEDTKNDKTTAAYKKKWAASQKGTQDGKGFTCACNSGFRGEAYKPGQCTDIDDCQIKALGGKCANGVCKDTGANSYSCTCNKGWTDFNCDYDVNECFLGKAFHDCVDEARCVNLDGTYTCRCLSGWGGDGFKNSKAVGHRLNTITGLSEKTGEGGGCHDLNDCVPNPCDTTHGKCVDRGANKYECVCEDGWGCNPDPKAKTCATDCDECASGFGYPQKNRCAKGKSDCTNNPTGEGGYKCNCRYPRIETPGNKKNGRGWYGDGFECKLCTTCAAGYNPVGDCEKEDRKCINKNECQLNIDNCHQRADCTDNDGSFTCECIQEGVKTSAWKGLGKENEWFGSGLECARCTRCYPGFHETSPCTSSLNRGCASNIPSGTYMIESEADDNRECVRLDPKLWYPTRFDGGNGEGWCGLKGGKKAVSKDASLVWRFTQLGPNAQLWKVGEDPNAEPEARLRVSDLYTIESQADGDWKCLFFGNRGQDMYPSLQACKDGEEDCPWGRPGKANCGFVDRTALIQNGQAIWKITPIKLIENKFIVQNRRPATKNGANAWECLVFEKQGAATNPSRYNWGNGDDFCGAGDWAGLGKEVALMNNKQAIFIITSL